MIVHEVIILDLDACTNDKLVFSLARKHDDMPATGAKRIEIRLDLLMDFFMQGEDIAELLRREIAPFREALDAFEAEHATLAGAVK